MATPFTIAKAWKLPECTSTNEWIKMWDIYIYTHRYIIFHCVCVYIYIYTQRERNIKQVYKKWNNVTCHNMYRPRDYHTEWSKSGRERQIYGITYIWSLK